MQILSAKAGDATKMLLSDFTSKNQEWKGEEPNLRVEKPCQHHTSTRWQPDHTAPQPGDQVDTSRHAAHLHSCQGKRVLCCPFPGSTESYSNEKHIRQALTQGLSMDTWAELVQTTRVMKKQRLENCHRSEGSENSDDKVANAELPSSCWDRPGKCMKELVASKYTLDFS